jgi:hypothetical protein
MIAPSGSKEHLNLLSRILLSGGCSGGVASGRESEVLDSVRKLLDLPEEERAALLSLADAHHVLLRVLLTARSVAAVHNCDWPEWAENALESERHRIDNALAFLGSVCTTLEAEGCPVVVIKSLDHWPDLGSDLDLFTTASAREAVSLLTRRFQARILFRSWGDRLANKWNFAIPGLTELIEVHSGRLGQTGEQVALARSLAACAEPLHAGPYIFKVPTAENRILVSTLQRMYRHFYLRLCDIADMVQLLETPSIDYPGLQRLAQAAGLWQGVATYLAIVSGYAKRYRGHGLTLPRAVVSAARFGSDQVSFGHGFLRIPLVPHSASFFVAELAHMLMKRELRGTLRLSLLPWLATAAALEQRITGQAKQVW